MPLMYSQLNNFYDTASPITAKPGGDMIAIGPTGGMFLFDLLSTGGFATVSIDRGIKSTFLYTKNHIYI